MLGPLPRLAGEPVLCEWQCTAAYHLERTLSKVGTGCQLIPLGRKITRRMGKTKRGLKGCEGWYKADGIHLSSAGYGKLAAADMFPKWLTLTAEE